MSWIAAGTVGVGAVGSIAGGIMGSSGARKQVQAMKDALAYQKSVDTRTYNDLTPYRGFGKDQVNSLSDWLNNPDNSPMSHLDPGYQFRRDQGNIGIENNAATAGLLKSGDTLRGLTTYGQDMSSQEYNNAFNRYLGEGQFKQGLAGMGEQAVLGGGGLANQGAANVGNITADTDWGGPDKVWGDVAAGFGGMAGNAMARRFPGGGGGPTPGGSNVFGTAKPAYAAGATTPWYMQA